MPSSVPQNQNDDTWGVSEVSPLRRFVRRAAAPLEARFGVFFAHRHHRSIKRGWDDRGLSAELTRSASSLLQDASASPPIGAPPVFVLGATWRSGSTLLQRLMLSSDDVLLWGEPWNRCDLIQSLRESLKPIDDEWPRPGHRIDELDTDVRLADHMVADLYPSTADLIASHRALFERLYGEPARARGYARWGFKETRLGAEDARYLHMLFPEARIVMLYRDPYASWSSYLALRGNGHERWPDKPVVSPAQFGSMWRRHVQGFLDYPSELPHMVVPYESLFDDAEMVEELGAFCGVVPDLSVLSNKVGRSHNKRMSDASTRRIAREVGELAERLGYARPST